MVLKFYLQELEFHKRKKVFLHKPPTRLFIWNYLIYNLTSVVNSDSCNTPDTVKIMEKNFWNGIQNFVIRLIHSWQIALNEFKSFKKRKKRLNLK